MVVLTVQDRTFQTLNVHFDENQELNIEIKDCNGIAESIVLDIDQIEELTLFLEKKIK